MSPYSRRAAKTFAPSKAIGKNVATFLVSDPLGSWLYAHPLHQRLAPLVWINAASTAAVLLFVPFLPRALLAPREGAGPGVS